MSGYTQVLNTDIQKAVDNWQVRQDAVKAIKDKATTLYYEKYYTQSGWWNRYKNRKKSPSDFLFDRQMEYYHFGNHLLHEFMTDAEYSVVNKGKYLAGTKENLKHLIKASSEDTCLLDEQLCAFVSYFKDFKL